METKVVPPVETSSPPAAAAPPSTPLPRRPALLPESLSRPGLLFWIGALPQALLLFLNWRAFTLAAGEMSADQRGAALWLGLYGLALCLGALGLSLVMRWRGRSSLSLRWCWPVLLLPVGYLALAFTGIERMVPATVADWILPRGELLYNQFLLTMPLVFYAGLRLACFERRTTAGIDFASSLGFVLAVSIMSYGVLVVVVTSINLRGNTAERVVMFLFFTGMVAITALVLGAFLRSMAIAYVGVRGVGPRAMAWFSFVVALLLPLGGLLLNTLIPFPTDLQSGTIYALTVLNGLLLLLPSFRHPRLGRAVWLAQCALFPFTLYFFLVFLPLLPLSLFAMILFGAGFLILSPVALFFLHAERLVDGFRCEVRDGSRRRTALLGLGAGLLLPAAFFGGAWLDRMTLRGAIDYVYSPELRQPAGDHFRGSPRLVGRSLERLRDFKAGLWMPFLTDAYNRIVFGGLVLPDGKMDHLHRVFLGHELPAGDPGREGNFFGSPGSRSRRSSVREVNAPRLTGPPATSSVVLENLARHTTTEGACERTRLTFTMLNASQDRTAAEFATHLKLPEAVRVSGFWLFVGPERVPGRLVEKKTAQWVYHRIRDAVVKRDPGILFYADPETLELRVFPFAAGERRTVEIELSYPTALAPTVRVGEQSLTLGDASATATVVTDAGAEGVSVALAKDADVPMFQRTPYLHFLVDRSADAAGGEFTDTDLSLAMLSAAGQLPEAREFVVTAGNYDCADLYPEPQSVDVLTNGPWRREFARRLPAPRGGWREERALRRGLLAARARLRRADDAGRLGRYPVFVVLRSPRSRPLPEGDGANDAGALAALARSATPDLPAYFVAEDGGRRLRAVAFTDGATVPIDSLEKRSPLAALARAVGLVRVGDDAAPTDGAGSAAPLRFAPVASAAGGSVGAALQPEVFDPAAGRFRPLEGRVVVVPSETSYAQGTAAALRHQEYVENPAGGNVALAEVAALSRRSGTLVGATSFIVVENSAQWEILRRKEAQKLANAPALEVEEVPEPATWALLAAGGAGLTFMAVHRRRRTGFAAGRVGENDSRSP